jgi:hypothetical protein
MARQARVKSAYAPWYPHLHPTRWQPVEAVRRIVLRQLRYGSPLWDPGERLLMQEHFEFRGETPGARPDQALEQRRPPRGLWIHNAPS